MSKNFLYKISLFLVFAIAIYLRFDAYLLNNSFFTDEILLAQNLFERSYQELFLPLNYFQSSSYIFLILSKAFTSIFGISEFSFRFIPFFSSILSVFLFFILLKQIISNKWVQIIGLLTFGTSYQLLFYSQTFKQYSSDVCISIIVLLTASKLFKSELKSIHWFLVGFIWSICIFASVPSCFIIAGTVIALIIKKWNYKITFSFILPFISFLSLCFFNFSKLHNSAYLANYWEKGYQIFSTEIYKINFDFLFHYYSMPLVLILLLAIGLFFFYRNSKLYFVQIISVYLLTLLAAYLKFYPFERRLTLFLLPILILTIIYPLDNLKKNWKSLLILSASMLFFLTGYFKFTNEYFLGNVSYLRQDVKPLLAAISIDKENTPLYLYYGSIMSYNYYNKLYNLPKAVWGTYPVDENLSEKYLISDLEKLPKSYYNILMVKGTWTYEKDLAELKKWINNNAVLESEYYLKSTCLLKILIK